VTLTSPARPDQSYRERRPAPHLAGLVSAVWIQEVAAEGDPYVHRMVPNGSAELSWTLGSDVVSVSGTQRQPTVGLLDPGSTVVGIRFRPGVARSILGPPASELVDLSVEADDLWGPAAATLPARLAAAGSPDGAARVLEDEVGRRIQAATDPDPLVTAAVGRLQPWRPDGVDGLASSLDISPRQLRRRFTAALGYGPKMLQRILRFQGFLALSQHGHQTGLARLAREAGYADQAHLTRESSELAGLAPKAFVEEMWRSCGPNHDHDASYAGLRRALLTRAQA
jgi:AraC-like DNA-binding protein